MTLQKWSVACAVLAFTACAPEESTVPFAESAAESNWVSADAPVRTTYLRIGSGSQPRELRYADVDGVAVFEGDIILGRVSDLPKQPGEVSAQGVAISGAGYRWPNALVPYTIDPTLPTQGRVTAAIRHWQERTNVRFILRDATNAALFPNFVTFQPGAGCSSSVGKRGGQQFVNLAGGCSTGNTIHEIGHALGLWHEQSREDRNSFVTIQIANVQAGHEHNFDQQITDGDDLGAYDYGSIMHYGAFDFSSNGQATIVVLTPGATIGQRVALSSGDIDAVAGLYPDPTYPVDHRFFTMDYDGDGDDDLVIRGPGGEFFAYRASGGSYTRVSGDLITTGMTDATGWSSGNRFFVADYDGDGDDDLIARDAFGTFTALRSNGTSFVNAGVLYFNANLTDANGWNDGNRFWVMDYDGDGDDDLVGRYSAGSFIALRSDVTQLTYGGVLATTSLSDVNGWNDGHRFFAADYDGDGDDDLITRNAFGDFGALRSDVTHLTLTAALYSNSTFSDANGWNEGNRFYVMDYDGDGDKDLVLRFASGSFVALRAEPTYLALSTTLATTFMSDSWGWTDPNRYFMADADGDGDDDLLARDSVGGFMLLRADRPALTLTGPVATTTFRDP
ncbi:Dot/Icm T4SS effector Zinc-dependent metalloprotease LegP [Pyxidicoccus caerfyrddinensis]|uniref:Dot/Icm T4SS effector Zinc-dependent metalloprotease LegP n=1 Tax=Pyxidicoccus caerfyrddinensis TaxID=2709663 RepID=UPI0013DAF448|nr:Dot/Icm T4SS effector Zinc-dependent metalloprotease LegP [Pyxidicoccus caerfyrddinensis]